MKKKFLSLFLLVFVAFGAFAGCGGTENSNGSSTPPASSDGGEVDYIDYAAQVTLDMESTDTIKVEVTDQSNYSHIDGDTTHFKNLTGNNLPDGLDADGGIIKARYLAVNTPESTGQIEEWGKAASKFTKAALASASSIVMETDGSTWERDANGRYLLWIWYKPQGSDTYRNLNVELLQQGLAVGSKISEVRYGSVCTPAIIQAKDMDLHIYSDEPDPDYYYGDIIPVTLKELRTNIASYNGKRVSFVGNSACFSNNKVYVEEYDEETDTYYGISVYIGYNTTYYTQVLKNGNRVYVVGEVQYYELGQTYQISDIHWDRTDKNNPEHIQKLEDGGHGGAFRELTIEKFNSSITVLKDVTNEDGTEETISTTYAYKELIVDTSVSMKDLTITDIYTTKTGDSAGAMTFTCKDASGKYITVRTEVLRFEDNSVVTDSYFKIDNNTYKTIDLSKAVVEYYSGNGYQIKVFSLKDIVIH